MDILLIVLGLLFLIASMALILNPPEAWIKKVFRKQQGPHDPADKPPDTSTRNDRKL